MRRFLGLWEHNRTREIPAVERVAGVAARRDARLAGGDHRPRRLPPRQHDVRRRAARLLAIFDWEMATIGDPLADVGYLCMMWARPTTRRAGCRTCAVTRAEGFPTRAELVARYEAR